ncbi:unnamed protein product [Echinostoma caproni]|uniref:Uncharacterized protein n=1 Tax=Echinostoma caproni TaxID=27848 RepID=A0A3P8IJ78_9TREM|nr:unnamed protein product [Echinostoma caproni]
MHLLLSGENIGPEEALRLHLIDHIIPGELLPDGGGRTVVASPLDETVNWLNRMIGKLPIPIVHATKCLIHQICSQSACDALQIEQTQLASVWGKQAHLSALASRRQSTSCHARDGDEH